MPRGPVQPIRGPIGPGPLAQTHGQAEMAAAQEMPAQEVEDYGEPLTDEEQLLAEQMVLESEEQLDF